MSFFQHPREETMFDGLKNATMFGLVLGVIAFIVSLIATISGASDMGANYDLAYAFGVSSVEGLFFGGTILAVGGVWWHKESSSNWAIGALIIFSFMWSGRLDSIPHLLAYPANLFALALNLFYPYWLIGYAVVAIAISFFEWRKHAH